MAEPKPNGASPWASISSEISEAKRKADAQAAIDLEKSNQKSLSGLSRKERKELLAATSNAKFRDYAYLMAVKPREGYLFRSDYFEIDEGVACILGYFHDESSHDDLVPFWGVGLLPQLPDNATAVLFEQVSRVTESWLKKKISESEKLDALDNAEQNENGTKSSRRKSDKVSDDLERIIAEIQDGASYLFVHFRILLKAPNIDVLDRVVDDLRRRYIDIYGNLSIAPHHGMQRSELSTLFSANTSKKGRGFYFTSTEFAGSFNLVTNGLNDRGGEFVGFMVGDVNNSGVLMDVDKYNHHVVVADGDYSRAKRMKRAKVADMWASKISQAALINNKRVVHLIFDGADLTGVLGPEMRSITSIVDMSRGDVNMFEIFGDRKDQLSLFSMHVNKIRLMAEQSYSASDEIRSLIESELGKVLRSFYIDRGMWVENAKNNQDSLRLVGIPHNQVPVLNTFKMYLDQQHTAMINSQARDDNRIKAISILIAVFEDMLTTNGDLFDTITSDVIDDVNKSRRIIYDFSSLFTRGPNLAMAQLVNILFFAASALGQGDTLIIHGADLISKDARLREYIMQQFQRLYDRGGRVAFCYNSVKSMLRDSDFNSFNDADWTVLGTISDTLVPEYEKKLGKKIPVDMVSVITQPDEGNNFLRRGTTNVVFKRDLNLGLNSR